jgi:L-arabinonolactonase
VVNEILRLIGVLEVQNLLGESAVWNARTGKLWWTDIEGRGLFRYDPDSGTLARFATPERLCSFAFVAGSARLLAAFETGLALYDPLNRETRWLHRLQAGAAPVRFNDGRTDRQGRFWAGTMAEGNGAQPLGRLYRLDSRGKVSVEGEPLAIANAICASPDGRRLYFADSIRRTIFAGDINRESGNLTNVRVFARTPETAQPDGANVDSLGYLWNAHWDAGQIVRYAPDGKIAATFDIPVSRPTSIAFGGREMRHLFVTTARFGLNREAMLRQPKAGSVFIYKTDVAGLADAEFAFEGA